MSSLEKSEFTQVSFWNLLTHFGHAQKLDLQWQYKNGPLICIKHPILLNSSSLINRPRAEANERQPFWERRWVRSWKLHNSGNSQGLFFLLTYFSLISSVTLLPLPTYLHVWVPLPLLFFLLWSLVLASSFTSIISNLYPWTPAFRR